MDKANQILLIATYDKMLENANFIVKRNAFPVTVIRSSTIYLDSIMQKWLDRGIEIVITRGGTYKYLKKQNIISTVEIKVNPFDILRTYNKIYNKNNRICFIGSDNVVYGVDIFNEVLNNEIYVINASYETKSNIEEIVSNLLKNDRYEFICDSTGVKILRSMGINGYLVESSNESILQAIQDAIQMLEVKIQEKARTERIKLIMDFIHEGIVAFDENKDIIIFNKEAQKLCEENLMDKDNIINLLTLDNTEKNNEVEIKNIYENNYIAMNKSPVIVDNKNFGMVATLQNINRIQKQEYEIRTKLAEKGLAAKYRFDDIIHNSEVMDVLIKTAKKYALTEATVLIQGDTGSGKELFAHSIHNYSHRSNGPFVAVNCAAFQENLLESEIFGYSDGAFTGARKGGKIGLFELAHTGTIFLDEIGDMPLNLQSRLLRVIQEKEVMRLGDEKVIPIDVRIIASTNMNLEESVDKARFREDLYYRINVLTLKIPSLNERKEDIKVLSLHMIEEQSKINHKKITGFHNDAKARLLAHNYRGNVRELKGIIERAVAITEDEYISAKDLRLSIVKLSITNNKNIKDNEVILIKNVLSETNNNITKAAKILGIDRSTLYRKLKEIN